MGISFDGLTPKYTGDLSHLRMLLGVVALQRTFNTFLPCTIVYNQFRRAHDEFDIIPKEKFCGKLR